MTEEELFADFINEYHSDEAMEIANDPLLYIYYRDSVEFASYRLRYHGNELLMDICESLRIDKLCRLLSKEIERMKNYKTLIISIATAVLFILMIVFTVKGTENRAIGLEENVQTTQSDIDVQIDRRFNVLTELAECVKQYDKHEYETLKDVIDSRGKNMSATQADEVMAEINAVAEAYPELKSNENYKQLMTEISTTENLLARYKQAFNESVKTYNRFVRRFPNKQFLDLSGYEVQQYEYYSTERTDKEPIKLFE